MCEKATILGEGCMLGVSHIGQGAVVSGRCILVGNWYLVSWGMMHRLNRVSDFQWV